MTGVGAWRRDPRNLLNRNTIMQRYIIIGTAGIGGFLAARLRAAGHEPFLINRSAASVEDLAKELDCKFSVADVTDEAALAAAIAQAGTVIDGLAYLAGTINLKPATRLTSAEVLLDFQINALGGLKAVQAALTALKASAQPTASVLFFSTVAVQQGFASHASVSMAKGAVEGLTRALAAELAPKIRVNAIAPSLTKTPLANFITKNEATVQALAQMHPLQRIGTADDIAAAAAFLLSSESSWITGQIIGVDGGRGSLRTKG